MARTSMATRLAASVVAISLISLLIATLVGVTTGQDLADDLTDERLRATVESAATDVGSEVRGGQRNASTLSSSLQAPLAIRLFSEAFAELQTIDPDTLEREAAELVTAYRSDYLEPLQEAGRDVQLRDIASDDAAATYLQYEYAIDLGAAVRPQTLDDADDGSTWSEVHAEFHPVYRQVVNQLDLLDLYLVDAEGTVVYSVGKRPDLGTNLETGPYSGSVLANTFDRVVADSSVDSVVSDIRFYDAVPGTPLGVVASPVLAGEQLVGVLMTTYDAADLTELVTADETWEAAGLPETADVYVTASDGLYRSDPRGYLEDPVAFLDAAEEAGQLSPDERERIEAVGTTVLTLRVPDSSRDAGREGDDEVRSALGITGTDVQSVVVPAETDAVEWFVVTEVDSDVSGSNVDDFQELLIVGAAIFVVVLAFLAVGWANNIVRPIRKISDRIGREDRSEEPIEVPPQSPVEIQLLASSLDTMKHDLASQQERVAEARHDRLQLLRSMLPASVAARIASGNIGTLEQATAASVVVGVILGLAELVRTDSDHNDRELVDQLHAELDDLAAAHGLDRIKVVGDAYYAACGHDRQYIDHAPRAVAFATEAVDAVRRIDSAVDLDVAVGIHSGPVTTGTAGGARLVYDVWGPTVSIAHLLARQATAGEIEVSDQTRQLLPDAVTTEPVDDGAFRIVSAPERARTS